MIQDVRTFFKLENIGSSPAELTFCLTRMQWTNGGLNQESWGCKGEFMEYNHDTTNNLILIPTLKMLIILGVPWESRTNGMATTMLGGMIQLVALVIWLNFELWVWFGVKREQWSKRIDGNSADTDCLVKLVIKTPPWFAWLCLGHILVHVVSVPSLDHRPPIHWCLLTTFLKTTSYRHHGYLLQNIHWPALTCASSMCAKEISRCRIRLEILLGKM